MSKGEDMASRIARRQYQRNYRKNNLEYMRAYQREWERKNRNLGPKTPGETRGRPRLDGPRYQYPPHLVVKKGKFVVTFD